ncbi:MAG: hypothetical protein V8Q43_03430 [Christensenellaceae bacterium]
MEGLANILETVMIICFGIPWLLSTTRSYRSRSTKGKSLMFSCFIRFGYICGTISKCLTHTYNLASPVPFLTLSWSARHRAVFPQSRHREDGRKINGTRRRLSPDKVCKEVGLRDFRSSACILRQPDQE